MDDKLIVIYHFTRLVLILRIFLRTIYLRGIVGFPLFLNVVVCITLFEEVLL